MRLLLDTHVLLWVLSDSKRIPDETRELIESTDNEVLFSAASIWEIAIKQHALRAELGVDAETIAAAARETDFDELAISSRHAAGVATLASHHKDPFDRLLVSQALAPTEAKVISRMMKRCLSDQPRVDA